MICPGLTGVAVVEGGPRPAYGLSSQPANARILVLSFDKYGINELDRLEREMGRFFESVAVASGCSCVLITNKPVTTNMVVLPEMSAKDLTKLRDEINKVLESK